MSLIYSKLVGKGLYRVYCEQCGVETDTVDGKELAGLCRGGYRVFCPECEGRVTEYHAVFRWEGFPFLVKIDEAWFSIDFPNSARGVDSKWRQRVTLIKEFLETVQPQDTASLACLVSTYLHNIGLGGGQNG